MTASDRFISERQVANGPRWQWLAVGERVKPKGRRKRGTVVAIIQPLGPGGVPMFVAVRWDARPKWSEANPTDCLTILDERREAA